MIVGILGLGLIGGSLARAYSKAGHTVLACEKDLDMLGFAQLAGAVAEELNQNNISDCDMILLAIYPGGSAAWLEDNGHLIRKDALVMDCCGTKTEICARCFPIAKKYGFKFIGGHPMAGTQFSGFKYSRASMFDKASMILVPEKDEKIEVLERVKKLLVEIGFKSVTITSGDEHDRIIAYTSQMAHVVSNAYVKSPNAKVHKGFSAGSYKDLTRVAKLNSDMWTELFLENGDNLAFEIDLLIENLKKYSDAIKNKDKEKLHSLLEEGTKIKESVD